VAKPRPEKKRDENKPTEQRVLPMQLQVGDRLTDETGEWEVVGRPYTTAGGKTARLRVQRVGEPSNHDLRTWGAHERVAVKR
jgi:hypothetical protein